MRSTVCPPDPGPSTQQTVSTNAGIKTGHDGGEESMPRMLQEKELLPFTGKEKKLLPFTGSNLRNQLASYKMQEVPIKGRGIGLHFPVPLLQQTEFLARCSTNCLMAEQGNPLVVEATQTEEGGRMQAGDPKRHAGKEVAESSLEGEEHVLVVNMTGAREAQRPQFLAVGLFLSVLLVPSMKLIDHMKKAWNLRGQMEASVLESEAGRKFVLVFSEEGDWKHAILAGPWQYKLDAFLVEACAEGEDPSSVPFTHVPMWVQFRNIPFYLLTKKLASDLGECIGSTMMVDSSARGNISDKFVRTRVKLPLYRALRMELLLADMITGEKVVVQIRYERLPNFCLFCGLIGHMEARCDLPKTDRKILYNLKLRVLSMHFEFPNKWFLPDAMGNASPQSPSARPWRAPTPANQEQKKDAPGNGVVEQVVAEVARLSVGDNHMQSPKSIPISDNDQIAEKEKDEDEKQTPGESVDKKKGKSWKRKVRGEPGNQSSVTHNSGEEGEMEPMAKKTTQQVVTLVAGQGEEDLQTMTKFTGNEGETAKGSMEANGKATQGTDGGMAAIGPGTTGKLSGAIESTRQEP